MTGRLVVPRRPRGGRRRARPLWVGAAGLALATAVAGCSAASDPATPQSGVAGGSTGSPGAVAGATSAPSGTASPTTTSVALAPLVALESTYNARLGVAVLGTGTDMAGDPIVSFRTDELFPYGSLSRVLTTGFTFLNDSDAQLGAVVKYGASSVVGRSPVTSQHVSTGMTLDALVEASLVDNDTTAAVLVSGLLGTPAQLQQQLRALGDDVTRVDRSEPQSLQTVPGDTADASSPYALATDLRGFTTSALLRDERRAALVSLLDRAAASGSTDGESNASGSSLAAPMRKGLPTSWGLGGFCGRTSTGSLVCLALISPPGRNPVAVALLTERNGKALASGSLTTSENDTLVTAATQVVAKILG